MCMHGQYAAAVALIKAKQIMRTLMFLNTVNSVQHIFYSVTVR